MKFLSRLIARLGFFENSRPAAVARTRVMRFEPLEDRRLLTAAPDDFTVVRIGETQVGLHWTPRPEPEPDVTGYEVEVSINGSDNWRPFFGHEPYVQSEVLSDQALCDLEPNEPCYFNKRDVYRSYYFRIQSLPVGAGGEEWSLVAGSDARPFNNPEDRTVIAHSQIDVPLIAATIELRWPEELAYRDADYTISRKEKDELSFTQVASLTWDGQNPITGWTDENLGSKTAYEYKVQRHRKEDDSVPPNFYFTSANTATGYVYAGVDVPLDDPDSTIESPGTVMLVIDITLTGMVPDEMDRLEDDLRAEGWDVLKIYVSPHDDLNPQSAENLANIESKRNEIIEAYEDPNIDLTAVLLLGHVPIPMSGNSSPDGHNRTETQTERTGLTSCDACLPTSRKSLQACCLWRFQPRNILCPSLEMPVLYGSRWTTLSLAI